MRKLIHFLFTFVLIQVGSVSCRAQDAAKIIDQYVKAAGGRRTISKVQTVSLDGNVSGENEANSGTYTFMVKQPNRYHTELRTGGKILIESYNGKSAWHQSDANEISTLLGREALEVEAAAQFYNARLVDLSKKKIGAAFKGQAQVRGRDALEVEFSFPTGIQWVVFFDANSHLIVEEKATIAGIPRDIFYDDYRTVNGLKVPYRIELHRGSDSYTVNLTRASVNEVIGERVFDFPRKSQVQLPDLKKLFSEIDANQKQIDKLKEKYTGTRVEEQTEFDKEGKVAKKEVRESTFFYLNGEEISTLVKKDGKPLDETEQRKETEKTKKRIEESQKEQLKKEAKEKKAEEAGKQDKGKDEPGIEVFLRVCQFVNPRHERFRGQDVLVFDFEPNPEYKSKNFEERVVQDLAGVVWVDEKAHDVVRLEAYFLNDVRFAGGLVANLQKGTSFILEQAFLNDEVWLPTYEEAHAGVRVFLVKGFKINLVTRYSDYKRFNVDTLNTINKPKEVPADSPKP